MKALSILFVGYVGYRLGTSDLRIRPILTAITVLVAATLNVVVRLVLPHEAVDRIAMATAGSRWSPVPAAVALLEASGIWVPVLITRWAAPRTRIAAAAYIIGAATQGALAYYQPFDVQIMNDEVLRPPRPPYELWLIFALIFAIVPFAVGLVVKRRQRTIASQDARRPSSDAH